MVGFFMGTSTRNFWLLCLVFVFRNFWFFINWFRWNRRLGVLLRVLRILCFYGKLTLLYFILWLLFWFHINGGLTFLNTDSTQSAIVLNFDSADFLLWWTLLLRDGSTAIVSNPWWSVFNWKFFLADIKEVLEWRLRLNFSIDNTLFNLFEFFIVLHNSN